MADNAKTPPPLVFEEDARHVFETMRIGTQEQRTRIVDQSKKANQPKVSRSYSLRLSYSSGSTVGEK